MTQTRKEEDILRFRLQHTLIYRRVLVEGYQGDEAADITAPRAGGGVSASHKDTSERRDKMEMYI